MRGADVERLAPGTFLVLGGDLSKQFGALEGATVMFHQAEQVVVAGGRRLAVAVVETEDERVFRVDPRLVSVPQQTEEE